VRLLRYLLILLGLALVTYAGLTLYGRATFDRGAWQQDFAQLLDHTSQVYANLEWVTARGVALPELKQRTQAKLQASRSDGEARDALSEFSNAFGDPHYRIHRVKLSKRVEAWWRSLGRDQQDEGGEGATPGPSTSGEALCARLGFSAKGQEPRFEFPVQDAQWLQAQQPQDAEFPTATVRLPDGKTVGLLRIGSFSERAFPRTCQAAWEAIRPSLPGPCDQACQENFHYVTVPNALLAAVERRVEQLQQQQVDRIAVDLTGNGGGTDWAAAAARLFAAAPVPCGKRVVARHPHWRIHFQEQARELTRARDQAREADRALLDQALQRLTTLAQETASACNRLPLWESGGKVDCKGTTQGELSACGLFAHLPPGAATDPELGASLEHTLSYRYRPGLWTGPVVLVNDANTASAAEQFGAMLLDAAKAAAIGERTLGAGCGYTRGGVPARLANSGLEVQMPDCARLRADGSNELEGLTPSVGVTWSDDAAERGRQLVEALSRSAPPSR